MTGGFLARWRRFGGDEDGSALLMEFLVMVPLLFGLLIMSVELSFYAMRHMYLDRGLDMTVRHIRLNTNTAMTPAQITDMISQRAGFPQDCDPTPRREIIPLDPDN